MVLFILLLQIFFFGLRVNNEEELMKGFATLWNKILYVDSGEDGRAYLILTSYFDLKENEGPLEVDANDCVIVVCEESLEDVLKRLLQLDLSWHKAGEWNKKKWE
ncbi:hypothetical protein ACP275_08G227500 [Erythranthe tilingii]